MNKKLQKRCTKIASDSVSKIKAACGLDRWTDEQVENYRKRFQRLGNELDPMIEKLGRGHLICAHNYVPGEMPYIIAFIGHIKDFKFFHEKYFAYDSNVVYAVSKSEEAIEMVRQGTIVNEDIYKDGINDYFFIKLYGGEKYAKDRLKPEIKMYGFNYEEHVPEICNPWYSDWQQFITDEPYQIYSIDECMDSIDLFIKESIDPEPVFGLDKLKRELNIE